MEGGDWIPCVVTFDADNGKTDEKYTGVLPEGVGAASAVTGRIPG